MTVKRTVLASIVALLTLASPSVPARAVELPSPEAEIFATNNTAVITDPADPRMRTHLAAFAAQVTWMIQDNGSEPLGSTLLSGVFWSDELHETTYERSREFHVDSVDTTRLHRIAELVRVRYRQESVLTFRALPSDSMQADAVEVEVPGIDVKRLHNALVANPEARQRLGGGSITSAGCLVLVAQRADIALVHTFVVSLGGDWTAVSTHFGIREFVSAAVSAPGDAA
ncbi:MAG: hypothetical protein JOZ47_23260 [Kutzneria sp.]|nr:hypothetical protein [Kutzneria sp.]